MPGSTLYIYRSNNNNKYRAIFNRLNLTLTLTCIRVSFIKVLERQSLRGGEGRQQIKQEGGEGGESNRAQQEKEKSRPITDFLVESINRAGYRPKLSIQSEPVRYSISTPRKCAIDRGLF